MQSEQARIAQDHQRQLEHVQKTSEANAGKLQSEHARIIQDHQRQLEHVQKTSEANADRIRKRNEAEIADLQSRISKLEADLAKVNALPVSELALLLTPARPIKITFKISRQHILNISPAAQNKQHVYSELKRKLKTLKLEAMLPRRMQLKPPPLLLKRKRKNRLSKENWTTC